MKVTAVTIAFSTSLLALAAFAEDVDTSKLPPPSSQKDVTFAKEIKPIFENSCVKCHGEKRPKGRLRLDSLEGALKGGEDGKMIIAGDSAKSPLVHYVGQLGDKDNWMPPLHNKAGIQPLSKDQVALIRAWIDQGAK